MLKIIFVDLGAYNGDTIKVALNYFSEIEKVYAFEPLTGPFEILNNRFGGLSDFILFNAGADIKDGTAKIFIGNEFGDIDSSLHADNRRCSSIKFENIKTIDFSRFVLENFETKEEKKKIILKINIEGMEYKIFNKMILDGTIKLIDEVYCDWHWSDIGISEEEHHHLIKKLRSLEFNLSGSKLDELYHSARWNKILLRLLRYIVYYYRDVKLYIKKKHPNLFNLLKAARARGFSII